MTTNKPKSKKNYWKYGWAKKIDDYISDFPLIRNVLRQGFIFWQSRHNSRKIRGKNNQILIKESILKNTCFDIHGDNNKIEIASQTIIENLTFHIRGSGHNISIGSNCRFNRGGIVWIEDENCSLVIGDNTFILEANISLTESNSIIEIGSDCMLSSDIDIRSGDSHSIIDLATGARVNHAENIKIEDHVWIGAHARVLKGVTIAKHSVVGMGSVVTKDVSSNTVVVGIPATTVRTNITWDSARV